MRGAKSAKWVAGAAVVALAATACGGNDKSGSDNAGGTVDPKGVLSYQSSEPQHPIQPANGMETGGGRIADAIFDGLVDYDAKTGALTNTVAESIKQDDASHYTIKVKKGWTFHNGETVTAKSFVDAWNWGANAKNQQQNASWFSDIEGYDKVHPAKGDPKAATMSGLSTPDDYTIKVTLANPAPYWTYKLGYTAFAPLPKVFYTNPKKYGQEPIGNGPYEYVKWNHNKDFLTKTYAKYAGPNKPKNGGVDFKFYTTAEAAYQDAVSNNLDVLDQVAPADMAKYHQDLGKRAVDAPQNSIQTIAVAEYAPTIKGLKDRGKFMQGISMAIDRDTITKTVLAGSRIPATGFVPPAVKGYNADACGEACTYNPTKAKQLVTEAGGANAKVSVLYNADGGHKEWVTAVCANITQNTGVKCEPDSKADFKTTLDVRTNHKVQSFYRSGWVQDYPLNANFLKDLYGTTAAGNEGGYSNKEFDKLSANADKAATLDESVKLYQEAEKALIKDMPAIPLWYYKTNAGYSKNVEDVTYDTFGVPVFADIQVFKK
ncbi:ABC transporter substrate-binding protein [Streptomyces sp. NBC_01387]|uniref:peptide ABC transporter substrate-binding protein n=1 Tax=unclassified Streptomyces TaxID=2593676 RepID=UPI002023BDE4|nr:MULTISPECIES: ABC transporter substrate-binding protein [unclassified Streptomyces]MCX4548457.1 ABC transporter substrate-binding protein [Streptomyces sp. NBC_01500]WSC20077.1 ABC transporter substrate-binding protein [Streptomyces sp. NBC_01766]WSV54098.1 ABC transporter substrate-binding protein [Streptomyces sp. NBC_01014]